MRRIPRIAHMAVIAMVLTGFGATLMQAKPEYTKKEGKGCVTCHTKARSKELNDVGKCYEKSKSLKDCK